MNAPDRIDPDAPAVGYEAALAASVGIAQAAQARGEPPALNAQRQQMQALVGPLLTKAEARAICAEADWPIDPDSPNLTPHDTALLKLRAYCNWPACIDEELSDAEYFAAQRDIDRENEQRARHIDPFSGF